MKSVNTWFASVSIYSIVVALVLFEFNIPAFAQSNSRGRSSQYSQQQLDDLQEFARQFREDSSLLPPAEATSKPQRSSNGVPAFGASYSKPRQDQDQQKKDNVFDPFSDLRPKDEPQSDDDDKSVLDPSPDPPVDENPNQAPRPQDTPPHNQVPTDPQPRNQDQSNPFSDDRAVDNLRDLDSKPRTPLDPPPRRNGKRNTESSRQTNPVDEEAIRRWEAPPDALLPDDNSQNYQRAPRPTQSAQPQQPRSSVEPFAPQQQDSNAYQPNPYQPNPYQPNPYQPNPYQPNEYQPNQLPPDYWAQPDPSGGQPQQPHDPYQGEGYQVNPNSSQPGMQFSHMNGAANGHSQAGQGTYFANPNQQWGVAGDLGCNGCGVSDCGFDCEALEFYFSGYGASVDLKNLVSGSNTLLTDKGGGWGLALGRRQGQNLRTELEYGWRGNNIIGFDEDGLLSDMTGKIKSQAGMANAYWEFVNFPTRCIKPYVGAGLGFARFDVDLLDEFGDSLTPERSKDSSFAYQFMGGVNYQPSSTVDLFIEYRLFRTDSFQFDTDTGFASGKYDYEASNLVGGLRWKF